MSNSPSLSLINLLPWIIDSHFKPLLQCVGNFLKADHRSALTFTFIRCNFISMIKKWQQYTWDKSVTYFAIIRLEICVWAKSVDMIRLFRYYLCLHSKQPHQAAFPPVKCKVGQHIGGESMWSRKLDDLCKYNPILIEENTQIVVMSLEDYISEAMSLCSL